MNTTSAILTALSWRILVALSTQTFFQPDEFYQSLEVAHRAVFGYGHLTWEWITVPPIRSVFFPALYIPAYWITKVTGWDKGSALIAAPKVLQGAIASITDISTRELARHLLGDRYADTTFLLSLTSFFHILTLSRTLSNSVETAFATAALCFWPWHSLGGYKRLQPAFALAATSCLIRPTSAVLWAFLSIELCWRARHDARFLKTLFITGSITALFSAGFLVLVDSLYFGKLTFTPLNFVLTNLSSVSLFYGRAPWYYYLTQAFPILLNVCLPSFIFGAWGTYKRGLNHQRIVLGLIIWVTIVYSLMGHKEWRFLHPVLPLMIILSAKSLVDSNPKVIVKKSATSQVAKWHSSNVKVFVICVLGVLPGLYVMRLHGRAQISVMAYLRSLDSSVLHSVGFLMPCHSTPWQAYLHKPELSSSDGYSWALSCEPPLQGENLSTYQDQTDIFYASPLTYLKQNFPPFVDPAFPPSPFPSTTPGSPLQLPRTTDSNITNASEINRNRWDHRWPSHFVFFGALLEEGGEGREVEEYVRGLGYVEVWAVTRNGWEEDWRRRGGVRVWAWKGRKEDGGD